MSCSPALPGAARNATVIALALSVVGGCQLLFGIEEREATARPDAGAAGSAGIRRCEAGTIEAPYGDWSCVRWEDIDYADTLQVTGQFSSLTPGPPDLQRFGTCSVAPGILADAGSALCEDQLDLTCVRGDAVGFEVMVGRAEHAEVEWTMLGETTAGSMWPALSERSSVDVGTIPLLSWSLLKAYADSAGIDQSDDRGVLILSTKDCAGNLMQGVTVRALADGESTGTPIAMHNVSEPRPGEATDHSGFAGVLSVETGWITVQAYLGSGCLVGEMSVFVNAREVTFVDMVPAASSSEREPTYGCPGGAGGQGGGQP